MLFVLYDKIVGKELVFKGGTCLYKIYKLNRFSEDLDFTATGRIDPVQLTAKLLYSLGLLGVGSRFKETRRHRIELNIRLLLHGPLYKGRPEEECFIPMNISFREKVLLEPKRESVVPMYRDIPTFAVFAMDEREILAEKMRAICSRETPRDVYDLWFLLVQKRVAPIPDLIKRKFRQAGIRFGFDEFMARVERKRGLWRRDLEGLVIGRLPDFDAVRKEIGETLARA